MFLNLVRNSSDALKGTSNAKIDITVQRDEVDSLACVRFKDNGPGIDKERLEQINEFVCSDKQKGMGIGLKVVR